MKKITSFSGFCNNNIISIKLGCDFSVHSIIHIIQVGNSYESVSVLAQTSEQNMYL